MIDQLPPLTDQASVSPTAIRVRLTAVRRQSPFAPVLLSNGSYQIGSDAHSDVCFDVDGVAPQHCVIEVNGSSVKLRALSRMTWVNDGPVSERSLASGDCITLGPVELRVTFEEVASAPSTALWNTASTPFAGGLDHFLTQVQPIVSADHSANRLSSGEARPSVETKRAVREAREALAAQEAKHAQTEQAIADLERRRTQMQDVLDVLLTETATSLDAQREQTVTDRRHRDEVSRLQNDAAIDAAVVRERQRETDKRQRELDHRIESLQDEESRVCTRQSELTQATEENNRDRQEQFDRERLLQDRLKELGANEAALIGQEAVILEQTAAMEVQQNELEQQKTELAQAIEEIDRDRQEQFERERLLQERLEELGANEAALVELEAVVLEQSATREVQQNDTEHQTAELQQRLTIIEAEKSEWKQSSVEWASDRLQLEQELTALQETMEQRDDALCKLRHEMATDADSIEHQERDLSQRESELGERTAELELTLRSLGDREAEIESARVEFETEQEAERAALVSAREAIDIEREAVNSAREAAREERSGSSEMSADVEALSAEVEAAQIELNLERAALEADRQRIETAREEHTSAVEEFEVKNAALVDDRAAMDELMPAFMVGREDLAVRERLLDESANNLDRQRESIADERAAVGVAQSALKEEQAALTLEREALAAEMDSFEESRQLDESRQADEEEPSSLESERDGLRHREVELESRLTDIKRWQSELEERQTDSAHLEESLDQRSVDINERESAICDRESELEEQARQLEEAASTTNETDQNRQEADREVEEAREELDRLRAELSEHQSALETDRAALTTEREALDADREAALSDTDISTVTESSDGSLREQQGEWEAERQQLLDKQAQLETERDELAAQQSGLEEQTSTLSNFIHEMRDELISTQQQLEAAQSGVRGTDTGVSGDGVSGDSVRDHYEVTDTVGNNGDEGDSNEVVDGPAYDTFTSEPEGEESEAAHALRLQMAEMFGLPESELEERANHESAAPVTPVDTPTASEPTRGDDADREDDVPAVSSSLLDAFLEADNSDSDDNSRSDNRDESHAESARVMAEETPSAPGTPTPVETKEQPLDADDPDSMQAYMQRLFARNDNSTESTEAPPPSPSSSDKESTGLSDVLEEGHAPAEQPVKAPRPVVDKEKARQARDSFRELANMSARSAVAKHHSQTLKNKFAIQSVVSGVCAVATLVLLSSGFWGQQSFVMYGGLSGILAGYMVWELLKTKSMMQANIAAQHPVLMEEGVDETTPAENAVTKDVDESVLEFPETTESVATLASTDDVTTNDDGAGVDDGTEVDDQPVEKADAVQTVETETTDQKTRDAETVLSNEAPAGEMSAITIDDIAAHIADADMPVEADGVDSGPVNDDVQADIPESSPESDELVAERSE